MERVSGVRGVATLGVNLLDGRLAGSDLALPLGAEPRRVSVVPIGGAFFDVAGLERLDGRLLTEDDITAERPLAVVSEDTARAYWPGRRATTGTRWPDRHSGRRGGERPARLPGRAPR